MKYISTIDSISYIADSGWEIDGVARLRTHAPLRSAPELPPRQTSGESWRLLMPSHVRVRPFAVLIGVVLGTIRSEGRLLYVSEFGIWPSSEDRYIYQLFRTANGGLGSLVTEPGHLFEPGEEALFESLLAISFDFGWGGIIAGKADSTVVYFDHDGHIEISSREQNEKIQAAVEKSKLPFIRTVASSA